MTSAILLLALSCLTNFCGRGNGLPLADLDLGAETLPTTTVLPSSSIEVKIKKATDTIQSLNKNIIDSLAGTIENDAHSSIGTYSDTDALKNSTLNSNSTSLVPVALLNTTGSVPADQKFSTVLKDLQEFEDHLTESISNFTATRQFAFRTMLRPMLQQVQQLRSNLTHLRNHMVGFHAITELQQQVSVLTSELGDVITSGRPGMETEAESESAKKPQQEPLTWELSE